MSTNNLKIKRVQTKKKALQIADERNRALARAGRSSGWGRIDHSIRRTKKVFFHRWEVYVREL